MSLQKCPTCNGEGAFWVNGDPDPRCDTCQGYGYFAPDAWADDTPVDLELDAAEEREQRRQQSEEIWERTRPL